MPRSQLIRSLTPSPVALAFQSCRSWERRQRIDTLGDKIMTPMVYQNRGGTKSLWASGTVCQDANCTQPTGVRWYQFDVTGGTFPANPVQQQTWTNAGDGLYRFMSSIAVDNLGNTAIGYAASSSNDHPASLCGRLML